MDLMPGACSQSTGQLPVSFNSVGTAVVTVAAISYMVTTGLGENWVSLILGVVVVLIAQRVSSPSNRGRAPRAPAPKQGHCFFRVSGGGSFKARSRSINRP